MGKPRRPGHSVWYLVGTQALEGISKVSASSPQLQDTISSAHRAATELRLHRKPRLWRTHVVSRAVRTPRCQLNYVPTAGCFFLVPPFISQKFLHIQLVHLSYAANLRKKAFPLVSSKSQKEKLCFRIHSQENSHCSNPVEPGPGKKDSGVGETQAGPSVPSVTPWLPDSPFPPLMSYPCPGNY